ncbi:MAG: hypothetical protein HKN40_14360 [Winogradskyella sp.]|uniref:hypothetical protein n=1 Tax=Winogradskyella sp. TaxID=1883156 RepID=UPI0018026646|nr:hypothetical protein [Winogradskyella sp.]
MIEPIKLEVVQEDDFNGIELHNDLIIKASDQIGEQPLAISYGVKFGKHVPIVTYGNFMCISGSAKVGKSWLKKILIAGYLGGKTGQYFSEIRSFNNQNKYVIDIDTEQSDYHVHRGACTVRDMVGSESMYYRSFALRSLSPSQRVRFLEWIFNESDYKGKIGICLIDGVADLVSDINNYEQATDCSRRLLKLTKEHHCAMITVIHTRYDSNKATGHIGSEVSKKAETIIKMEKNDDTYNAIPLLTRNMPLDEFSFIIKDGIPQQDINF